MRETHPLPSINLMRAFGLEPDPWQLQVLEARPKRLLLNCSRQAGKSTTVAILALGEAVMFPKTLVLMLSRSLRQSTETLASANPHLPLVNTRPLFEEIIDRWPWPVLRTR
jgi:hypothetical protein